ncbi:hypothetical protein ATCC90586_010713 [Pythium insidiosum]|nr:hypothetical protein ATCC90586_010713 [Pythium insidiosum]
MASKGLSSPSNDLTVPLNDVAPSGRVSAGSGPHVLSPMGPRARKNTTGSEDLGEKVSKMKIDFDDSKKKRDESRINPDFRYNMEMAMRVAFGVLIASMIQTKDPDPTDTKKWYLFPDWYYLGGLSYCAVAVIFSAQKNVGATLREVCQAFYGVGMALVYNIILFAVIDIHMVNPSLPEDEQLSGYIKIERTFNSKSYFVNKHNFFAVLPWMMAFTVVVLLLPIENNTKKFALGNNLYFALTIINPMNPSKPTALKTEGDTRFDTANVLRNLELYFFVGFIGTLISFVVMLIPYPVFASRRLRMEATKASEDILDLLNIIIDSYCFKNKNVEHMNFLRHKLRRKFDAALARHRRMNQLIEDVWWEQLFGFHLMLKFNRSMIKNYVRLVGSLISDLRSLNNAMQLEKYEHLHFAYMKSLQREIYMIQLKSGDLLSEISKEVHDCVPRLDLRSIAPLEAQMENTLIRYRITQNRILRAQKVSLKDIEGNVPLNLFLFSLNSFCSTLVNFQTLHNEKEYDASKRARSFIRDSIRAFFVCHKYDRLRFMSAFKASAAIFAGILLAVYVYAFSHTTPAAVAYVMGNHIGGSFSVTVNRVGGVVAGSVVPSVFQFFISQVCQNSVYVLLSNVVLFLWVAISMYVRFAGGYGSYAGLVSAFIAAGILLRQQGDDCSAEGNASLAIASYSSMAQTSVGILLFIVMELALCPESASGLLRENIQKTLHELHKCFETLFGHHLSSTEEMSAEKLEEIRLILQVKVPALLVEQEKLLTEANVEPMLWKPAFSYQKYESVLDSCYRLLNNNNLLFKLVRWFNYRVESKKVDLSNTVDIRDADGGASDSGEQCTHQKWQAASHKFQKAVGDSFDTLDKLFGDGFLYADPEQTALFMQMKEAFRLADKDCSGEIDAEEVAVMLEAIFMQSGAVKESEIHKYVEEFMAVVDKDNSGKVSFEEFTNALDNGLKLEVEVYTRRKPKAPELVRQATQRGLSAISEEVDTTDDHSESQSQLQIITPKARVSASAAKTPKHGKLFTPKARTPVRATSTVSSMGISSPTMRRQHEILNVEDFSLGEIAGSMKSAYVEWLMANNRFEKVTMEELLLLNCLVSGAEGIAHHLTKLEEVVVSQ